MNAMLLLFVSALAPGYWQTDEHGFITYGAGSHPVAYSQEETLRNLGVTADQMRQRVGPILPLGKVTAASIHS